MTAAGRRRASSSMFISGAAYAEYAISMISAAAEAPPAQTGAGAYTKWAIGLFFLVMFIPGSFYIGVRMTPYRLYLILMAVPMVLRFRADPTIRITAVDALVFLAIFWRSLALVMVHQTSEILNAGSSFIELFFGYMIGRVFVRSPADYRFFFRCFLVMLLALLPFALVELVTFSRPLRKIFSVALVQPPEVFIGPHIRFGLMRVQAAFDHALLYGVFCSIGFANMVYLYRFPKNLIYAGFVGFMTLLAISSSSMIALVLQACLMVYERVLRPVRVKWLVLGAGALVVLYSFELIFGKSIPDYIVTELALNQAGAETRLDQITYGLKEVWRHPMFGIGLNVARLPFWRSDIFDNFWLHTAVRFGIPAFLFIVGAFALHFLCVTLSSNEGRDRELLRIGYAFPFVTLVLLIGSISVWGSLVVFIMAYLGAGAWFYNGAQDPPAPAPREGRREPAPRRQPPPRRAAVSPGAAPRRASGAAAPGVVRTRTKY